MPETKAAAPATSSSYPDPRHIEVGRHSRPLHARLTSAWPGLLHPPHSLSSSLSICALNRPPEGNASSTLTSCLHCVITAPPQPHDARPYDQPRHALQDQRHPPSVQVPRRRLRAAQRRRVIDSPALDGNELCAAPSYLRCALALPSPAPFRPARHPRSSPSTFTPHPHRHRSLSSPLTTHHPFTLALTLTLTLTLTLRSP